jgi:hypothetical protein
LTIPPRTTIPVSSAFSRVLTSIAPSSGNVGIQIVNTSAGPSQPRADSQPIIRTSAFDRLQAPPPATILVLAHETAPRVLAFQCLLLPE